MDKIQLELFDSHAHLADEIYSTNLAQIIQNAKSFGVEKILCVGDSEKNSKRSIEIARQHSGVYAAVGVHPHDINNYNARVEKSLKVWSDDPKVLAIGEIGLDYYRMTNSRSLQIEAFIRQLDVAVEVKKPVVLHCRDAYEDMLEILKDKHGLKGVIHCFSSNTEDALKFIEMGYYIGITGIITFKNSRKLVDVVKSVPIENLLIETDCPYLAPEPNRGAKNEPANVVYVARAIAQIKNMTYEDVANTTTYNARHLFNLVSENPAQIAYAMKNSLYLNITNKCPNNCIFCKRNSDYMIHGIYLKLSHEPSYEEVIKAAGKIRMYDEIVFCGYGEPTERLDLLKKLAANFKNEGIKVRLNTNGLGNLINGRNILPELKGLIDSISISLNASTAKEYKAIANSKFNSEAFREVVSFIHEAKNYIPEVVASVVKLPYLDIEACKKLAEDLKVNLKIRNIYL